MQPNKTFTVTVTLHGPGIPLIRSWGGVDYPTLQKMEMGLALFVSTITQNPPPSDSGNPRGRTPVVTLNLTVLETGKNNQKHASGKVFASSQFVWYDVPENGLKVLTQMIQDSLSALFPLPQPGA
jgi:hypothetical protein